MRQRVISISGTADLELGVETDPQSFVEILMTCVVKVGAQILISEINIGLGGYCILYSCTTLEHPLGVEERKDPGRIIKIGGDANTTEARRGVRDRTADTKGEKVLAVRRSSTVYLGADSKLETRDIAGFTEKLDASRPDGGIVIVVIKESPVDQSCTVIILSQWLGITDLST